jgi:hypothetical protein
MQYPEIEPYVVAYHPTCRQVLLDELGYLPWM